MRLLYLVFAFILCCQVSCSETNKEIKIGFVEGLSGPFANIGEVALRHLELEVEAYLLICIKLKKYQQLK